jgi:hypothetical protein
MHFAPIQTDIPVSSVPVPDTMSLLPKGFDTLFTRKDQDCIVDRKDCHHFEKNMKYMLHERSSRNSVVSASVVAPMDTPVGQYNTASNTRESSSLFTLAQASPPLPTPTQYQPPLCASSMPYVSHQMAFDPLAQEHPFLANMTKMSHCSKFKKILEDSIQLTSDS